MKNFTNILKLTICFLSVIVCANVYAQTDDDALRYSLPYLSGNARYVGIGGAFGALGGNLSTMSSNPAGIGMYNVSEASVSPGLTIDKTFSNYQGGSQQEDLQTRGNFGNFGIVGVVYEGSKLTNDWRKVQLGFGFNRLNNFNNRTFISGKNTVNSQLDAWTDDMNNGYNSAYSSSLAYDLAYINYDTAAGNYYNIFYPFNGTQKKDIQTSGYVNEMTFSIGGNYSDILYLGMTVGVPFLRYYSDSKYTETKGSDSYDFYEHLSTEGYGINAKFGAIVRATDFLRVGLAYHTPTKYMVKDHYNTSMYDPVYNYPAYSPNSEYDYDIYTPDKFVGSLGFIIGKIAAIGVEYEFVNYSKMKMHPTSDFEDVNATIKESYHSTGNLKIGAEVNLAAFRLRAGYNYYGSPYKNSDINDWSGSAYTAGLGFNVTDGVTFDVGYVYTQRNYDYFLYSRSYVPPAKIEGKEHQIIATLGFKF